MIPRLLILFSLLLCITTTSIASSPKLIVVIVVDQFRYDYLDRFGSYFDKGGFNYLLKNGANFTNASFKHANTSTGPGHAVLLSGSYGNVNGIIANDWYDQSRRKWTYCVEDTSVQIVGSGGEGRSPRNFTGSTLGDELRLKTGFHAKVVSISAKDRSAILMAGMMPSGVFWLKDSVFVTSTYYMKDLPDWVKKFNQSRYIDSFFGKVWSKSLPDSAYRFVDDDDAPYEGEYDGMGRTFPHKITGRNSTKITPSYYWSLARSPFGAEVLKEFAKQAVDAEKLGQRGLMDMLCLSLSPNDIVGHAYGPHSMETMDFLVRMDAVLADFFSFLDKRVGLGNCVFVLSSDHGIAPIPEYMKRNYPAVDAGRISVDKLKKYCSSVLTNRFGEPAGEDWIDAIGGNNIYFNRSTFKNMRVPTIEWAASELADSLRRFLPIAAAYSSSQIISMPATTPIERKIKRSFDRMRSGDVVYALKPYWREGDKPQGAAHGEPYEYDAHVPVIIVGGGIRPGKYANEASPADIAPTLSALLGIEFPAGRDGRVLVEALK